MITEHPLEALSERSVIPTEPNRLPDHDTVEPRCEAPCVVEAVATAPRPLESRLHRVLRIDRIAADEPRETDQARIVLRDELGDVALDPRLPSIGRKLHASTTHRRWTLRRAINETDRSRGSDGSTFPRSEIDPAACSARSVPASVRLLSDERATAREE